MQKPSTSVPALISFALAGASVLLAIFLLCYGFASDGFPHHDPLLLASSRIGIALSAAAAVFAMIALRQPTRLRWLWFVLGVITLIGWFVAGFGK